MQKCLTHSEGWLRAHMPRPALPDINNDMASRHVAYNRPAATLGNPTTSAFGQLQLDTAVAAISFLARSRVDRLLVGKTGSGDLVYRDPLGDRVADDRDRARRRQLPLRGELVVA